MPTNKRFIYFLYFKNVLLGVVSECAAANGIIALSVCLIYKVCQLHFIRMLNGMSYFFFNVNYVCFSCKCFYISLSNKIYFRLCMLCSFTVEKQKERQKKIRKRIVVTFTPKPHQFNLYILQVAVLPEDKFNNILKELLNLYVQSI